MAPNVGLIGNDTQIMSYICIKKKEKKQLNNNFKGTLDQSKLHYNFP